MSAPRYSIVIPAYNEARLLPRLLASLQVAAARVEPGRVEIIVADNSSTDATAELARAGGARVASVERRAIAAARNGGARLATGDVLGFVDADSIIHPDTFVVLDRALASPRVIGGATGVRPDRWSVGIAVMWAIATPMIWLTGFDSGLVFCWRTDFEAVGGYREELLVAEDVDFLVRLRRHGRKTRRRFVRPRGARTTTSMRKFDKYGDWHFIPHSLSLGWKWIFSRGSARRGILAYWYEDR